MHACARMRSMHPSVGVGVCVSARAAGRRNGATLITVHMHIILCTYAHPSVHECVRMHVCIDASACKCLQRQMDIYLYLCAYRFVD